MLKNIFKDNLKTIRLNSNGFSHLNNQIPLNNIEITEQDLLVVITHKPPISVPLDLYNPDKNIEYLKIQFDPSEIGKVVVSEFKDYALINFLTPQELNFLENVKASVHFMPLFLYQILHIPQVPENTLLIDVQNHCLQCALLVHEELQFITYFNLIEDTDCLYHLMNICSQFKIDPEDMNLFYISLTDTLESLLQNYYTLQKLIK